MIKNYTFSPKQEVNNITPEQRQRILDFFQGAVYTWCIHNPNQWFDVKTFVGGENWEWYETPLQVLYDHYKNEGLSNNRAMTKAGMDAGNLLCKTLWEDKRRIFETNNKVGTEARLYRWAEGN